MVPPAPAPPPNLGGKLALGLFVFTLLAFVAESQLTQYVQTTLGYRQPFLLFYIVHSSFFIIFPLHLLYLMATTKYSARVLLNGLSIAITDHLLPPRSDVLSPGFPYTKFIRFILLLTLGITCPALLWFAAVSLASISDVTAIWNTNAFFAYLITVKLFNLKWEPRRLIAVLLATLGTLAVVYGGSTASAHPETPSPQAADRILPTAPLIGDLLTLVASFGYGLYQVLYKKYAALPSDPSEVIADGLYEPLPDSEGAPSVHEHSAPAAAAQPPPFGLHPNLLTSAIGFCTFAVLWIPIPVLHVLGIETFAFPANYATVFAIAGIALSGVLFNAGFMVLLGIWGPILTSVSNLLTVVLVFVSDVLFGAGIEAVTLWSLTGSGVIIAAFAVLAYDMASERH